MNSIGTDISIYWFSLTRYRTELKRSLLSRIKHAGRMRPDDNIKRIATRFVAASLLVLPLLFLLISLTTSNVAAESVSGTWTSNTPGKGYVQNFNVFNANYDAKLVLSQTGTSVSGTFTMTCTWVQVNPGYETWQHHNVGDGGTFSVSGTMSGTTLSLTDPSGAHWTLHMNGDKMTGSGSYTSGGITYTYVFDLRSGSGGDLAIGNASLTGPAMIAIIGGGACLAASLSSAPKGRGPQQPGNAGTAYNYQPSNVQTTNGASGSPTDMTYMGGAGLQYPNDYVNGVPNKPKYWQSQQGPLCPIHGTLCTAQFVNADEPGAWFCPKCRDEGRNLGFPWGRQ
jgi:hypothetical protein